MNRRDLLSTASAAGALVLTGQSGARPASAGILDLLSVGIVFKACVGSAIKDPRPKGRGIIPPKS